jgi:hypothetical protein
VVATLAVSTATASATVTTTEPINEGGSPALGDRQQILCIREASSEVDGGVAFHVSRRDKRKAVCDDRGYDEGTAPDYQGDPTDRHRRWRYKELQRERHLPIRDEDELQIYPQRHQHPHVL